jgi:prephenate dehydrogenase
LVVVAVPPAALARTIAEQVQRFPRATVTDVGSVKAAVLAELVAAGVAIDRYVGSHPMAGSHRSGPLAARVDLFVDRTWVITPHSEEDYARTSQIEQLARLCGSRVVLMSAEEHDVAVAQVSHLPQLMSSMVAGHLNNLPYRNLALAGQGMRDITRIAASDAELWGQIIALNRQAVREELEQVRLELTGLIEQLDNTDEVRRFIERGRHGVEGLPGKHGRPQTNRWEPVVIEIPDRPGALAEIFALVGQSGVNVEDIAIEHDQTREVGFLTIAVDGTEQAARLTRLVLEMAWRIRA